MTFRNAARADFDQVGALFLACDLADVGEPDPTVEDLAEEGERPGFELERDAWVAVTPSGDIAGYGEIWERYAGEPWAFGCVHPEHRGRGVGTELVRLAESGARELGGALLVSHVRWTTMPQWRSIATPGSRTRGRCSA